ncbi:MAG TPA: polymer-forming cytoskeletal protein [Candidatus Limnocylindrales bacterium]|nr:polymer-forming cytoskeletal protein [Candidatus Limnocylindrales bacterium]
MRTRTRPWIAAVSLLILMFAALLVHAPSAQGATSASKARAKAVADSIARAGSRDEGISVRVIEDGKQTTTKTTRSRRVTTKATDEDVDAPDTPDKADAPDVPEPPDVPDHGGDNDLVRFGQDIEISPGQVVDGSVVAIGGSILVRGRVKGDCTAVGGSVSVKDSATVEGDAVSVGGQTTVDDGATVRGSNVSVGGWPHGSHAGRMLPFFGLVGLGGLAVAGIFGTLGQLLVTILLAWLCLLLARERIQYAVDRMGSEFGKSFLWGLVGWMAMIVAIPAIAIVGAIAMVILVITIIGIPVAILLLIAMVFALIATVLGIFVFGFLGFVNGSMYIGRKLLARKTPGVPVKPIHAIIAGVSLILGLKVLSALLGFLGTVIVLPVGIALGIASAVLGFVLTTTGMGGMVLTRFAKGPLAQPFPAAAPAAPGTGWYEPPPPPPSPSPSPLRPEPPPAGGSSDAP